MSVPVLPVQSYPIQHKLPNTHTLYLVPVSDVLIHIPNAINVLAQWFVDEWPQYYNNSITDAINELTDSLHLSKGTFDVFFVIVDWYNIRTNHIIYGCIALLDDDMGVLTPEELNSTANPVIPDQLYHTSMFTTPSYDASKLSIIDYVHARGISQCVANVYVPPEYRHYGIAISMMKQVLQYAKHIMSYTYCHLWSNSIELADMYSKLGWVPYKRIWSYSETELLVMRIELT